MAKRSVYILHVDGKEDNLVGRVFGSAWDALTGLRVYGTVANDAAAIETLYDAAPLYLDNGDERVHACRYFY